MYKACRCEVCGEMHLGTEKPEVCPFCGAHKLHLESVDSDEIRAIIPDDFDKLDGNETKEGPFLELEGENLSEVSKETIEEIKKSVLDSGIRGGYSILAEDNSSQEAERFMRNL